MKKILSTYLLLASSAAICAACDPYDISNLSFDEQMRYVTALSSGISKEKAFIEATGRKAGYQKSLEQEEAASLELIAAMQFEDPQWGGSSSRYDRGDRKSRARHDEDEVASLALIAAMGFEDHDNGSEGGGGGFAHSAAVYRIQTHAKVADHRKTLAPIVEILKKVQQGADVHGLDAHVAANIATIHVIAEDFAIDNSKLTVAEIKGYLEGFLKKNPDFYKGYEATAVTHPQLLGYIDAALATASADASTLQMYSRLTSLIQLMEKEGMDTRTCMQHFFDEVSENYLTQGGCFQGVRNRGSILYAGMLNSLMG